MRPLPPCAPAPTRPWRPHAAPPRLPAKAVKLAAQGKAEQTTAFLQLEQLKEELAARAQVMQARTRRGTHLLGKGRMLRAYPKLKHGQNNRSLNSLLEQLEDEYPDSFNGFGIQER